jgi:hypothetical protein
MALTEQVLGCFRVPDAQLAKVLVRPTSALQPCSRPDLVLQHQPYKELASTVWFRLLCFDCHPAASTR